MNTAAELLRDLEARGVLLHEENGGLAYDAPDGALRDADFDALKARKADVLAMLRKRHAKGARDLEGFAGQSLYRLTHVLEVTVPWTTQTLFVVPGSVQAAQLEAEGVNRGRIWDTAELLDLILTNVSRDDARSITEAKLVIDGAVVGARDRLT